MIINKMSNDSINELRTKIKKLKYKIEKEETNYTELRQHHQQYKAFGKGQLSLGSVLKKINFMLALKGMHIGDWLNAVAYDSGKGKDDVRMSDLIHVLEAMGVKLAADQKFILLNFVTEKMSEVIGRDEIIKCAQKMGVRTYD